MIARWLTVRIGELAKGTGVSVRALRYYEEQDLLQPAQTGATLSLGRHQGHKQTTSGG
jgi:MerR family regulatory protein